MNCGGCGYLSGYHKLGSGHCPNGEGGYLKTVTFSAPPPPGEGDFRVIMRRDYQARMAAYDELHTTYEPEVVPPPIIAARAPAGPLELAGYQGKQAIGLGRKAAAAGWAVDARYWKAHDGTEGCAVRMTRDELYAVATWKRKPAKAGTGSGWEADIAYGVRRGDAPVKLTHTQLEGVITT
jgi:hypothetical protein